MKLAGRGVVVTGGAAGIGRAMCVRFVAEGARAVVIADREAAAAHALAAELGPTAHGMACDVAAPGALDALVAAVLAAHGAIDLFCSNAGIGMAGGVELPDADWQRIWEVNVMAHVWAARAVLPSMLARGEGYLLQTASAAGLLTNLGAAPYAVTKHAAVALAEWLAITHGAAGIRVSCLCPMGVRTDLLERSLGQPAGDVVVAAGPVLEPAEVAEHVVRGLEAERFLILPHAEVGDFMRKKAADPDRFIGGMRAMLARLAPES
jgi:NAD(P)-dependent dehydrogenase (short-subunit alcohol dehydrogenase family)